MNPNALMVEQSPPITALAPILPSTSTPDFISMKNYDRLMILIVVDNGATVTGSAITLKQATVVAGTDEKALGFDSVWANIDTAAADTLVKTAVTSDTFTTDTTDAKNLLYAIEIEASSLDVANGFDCVRVGTGDGANMVLAAIYIPRVSRYAKATPPSAILD
jgi:hypothetical protein